MSVQRYGRWLREQRESVRPRLTQRKLAEVAGISHTYLARLEAAGEGGDGPFEPREDKIDAISRALEKYVGRTLVNEARGVIGYRLLADEEDTDLPPPVVADDEIAILKAVTENGERLPPILRRYIAEKWLKEVGSPHPRRPLNGKSESHRSVSGLCVAV